MQFQDLVSQKLSLLFKDVGGLSGKIRKELTASNEKNRSVGFLQEQLEQSCELTSQHQEPTTRSALIGFGTIIERVEYSRKCLYLRLKTVNESFLQSSSQTAGYVQQSLQKRTQSLRRLESSPGDGVSRTNAATQNSATVEDVVRWSEQYNQELRRFMRDYAHSQLEFASRCLENWSTFMEDISLLDFSSDTDNVVRMLEEGGSKV